MLKQHSAGKNIASYCTKCKLSLDHTIVAMDGEAIAKVRCNTCGSRHKFRDPADAEKVRTPRARGGEGTKPTAETLWEDALTGAKGKERVYDMTAKYRIGDIVLHHTFGKGVVQKLYVNKCDMLFKDRERLMASAN
jgi:uncharacterized Zn finger protein